MRIQAPRLPDRGQVSVELLGITPLILLVLLLVWQFVLVGYTYTLAGNAADEAARAAAVGADPQTAAQRDLPGAWSDGVTTSVATGSNVVTARVALHVPMLVPGFLDLPALTVNGESGAAREQRR
ncbi:TadE/TadG family type IV pilus assembly protein [Streptomyces silvisoli]|uniref:TadE/TadG family type IV pilus assembly protein n=1 Tax=Streptomyces silvisoli TaxID=3034235 RepID=A0ABT5ZQJ9_9ACTN|nr:TadE/TadG family type IV pilus assembly protein [Streptomyces silvisoli]MDF3292093.1 TadE/TadG family type IV pilus assembly protein [Streptomyces silvisoli]